jgi:hypothetical protein
MARQSREISEDAQPVITDEDAEKTAQGSLEGTAGLERTDPMDDLQTGDLQPQRHGTARGAPVELSSCGRGWSRGRVGWCFV